MKTTIQEQDGQLVAILEGRLDTAVSEEVEEQLSPLHKCKDKDIVIDCTNLTYISSSGLRLLLDILKNAQAHGHHVYMKDISNTIREAFTLTGFIGLFEYL